MTDDQNYFYDRAEAELAMAQKAAAPQAVKAHYMMAGIYLDHAYGDADPRDEAIRAALPADPG